MPWASSYGLTKVRLEFWCQCKVLHLYIVYNVYLSGVFFRKFACDLGFAGWLTALLVAAAPASVNTSVNTSVSTSVNTEVNTSAPATAPAAPPVAASAPAPAAAPAAAPAE